MRKEQYKESITAADMTQGLWVSGIRPREQTSKVGTLPSWRFRRIKGHISKEMFDPAASPGVVFNTVTPLD